VLLSPLGRIDCVVKGARKSRRWGALIEPFSHFSAQFRVGGGMPTLSDARLLEGFPGMRTNLERLRAGALWLDLLSQIAQPDQESPDLFEILVTGLHLLEGRVDPMLVGLWLEANVLCSMGLATNSLCNSRDLPDLQLEPRRRLAMRAAMRRSFTQYEPQLQNVFRKEEDWD